MFLRKKSSQQPGIRQAKKSLRLESLEDRQLLSVNISEVHFNPTLADPIKSQYLELKSDPGSTVPSNLYFLSVESDGDSVTDNPGKINAIFSLGGLAVGANGYMAFLQQDAPFSADPSATSFQGTTGGFKGMPGDIYDGFTGQFESLSGSESFLIIENVAGSAPLLSSDIDTNDDGIVDPGLNWNVLDSVTYFKEGTFGSISGDVAYGDIVYRASGNTSNVSQNATLVDLDEAGYVGRVLGSTGYGVDDWVAGATKQSVTPSEFEISDGDNGKPSPPFYAGRRLDHIGAENFFNSITGTAGNNYVVFIDRDNNGTSSDYIYTAEPDNEPPTAQLGSAFSNVTLVGAGPDHEPSGASITSSNTGSNASTGSYSFSYSGISTFSSFFQMRMDFLQPTGEVQIDFTGNSDAIGKLIAFDAAGNTLDTYTTPALTGGSTETMSVAANDNIAYAVAFAEQSSGYLDNLKFLLDEEEATADGNGEYTLSPVWEHEDTFVVQSLFTGEAEGVRTSELPATHVDFALDPEQFDDIFGRSSTDGSLNLARNNILAGQSLSFEDWGSLSTGATWDDILVADVNGDSMDDVVGRTSGGQWWVALSTGNGFTNQYWGKWSGSVVWEDVVVGDFDGDGTDDIAGRTNGQWWLARSQGTHFTVEYWGRWSNSVTWEDVVVGDFDADGKDDIAGRTNGQWWVSHSQGSFFTVEYWGNWSNSVTWEDVVAGDFNGDGKTDIAGRASGNWWVSNSQGTFFTVEYWGNWSNSVTWEDVMVADVNGDSQSDIVGRANGTWWASRSHGTYFGVELWGNWSTAVTWDHVVIADLNGDSMDDIVGVTNGSWWPTISQGSHFSVESWGNHPDSVNWQNVQTGEFGAAAGGSSLSVNSVVRNSSSVSVLPVFGLEEDDENGDLVEASPALQSGRAALPIRPRVRRGGRFD